MRTSTAALELDFTEPSITTAKAVVIREKASAWLLEAMRFDGIEKAAKTPLRLTFTDQGDHLDPGDEEDLDDDGDDAMIDTHAHEQREDVSQGA